MPDSLAIPQNHERRQIWGGLIGYKRVWLRNDLLAGLITAAVVIPIAMAYATVAGLPIQAGLYTALVPMVIYAALGTSRSLSVSSTTTIAILVGAELEEFLPGADQASLLRAASTLALMVGAILTLASFLRLGFLANFISEPVLVGFKAGIGLVIILDQVPKLLGVHFPRGRFVQNLLALIQAIPETSLATLAVGIAMILLIIGIEHWFPRAPAPLIIVVVGIIAMRLFGLESYGVKSIGPIPRGLPPLILPDFSLAAQLGPGSLGIALISFTETIAVGRAFAAHDEPLPHPNRELLALGLANAGGAFLGAMPAGGGTTQTTVNRLAGAQTQLAEIVTAGATLLTMLFLAPLISRMPQATLAAIVIVYSSGLIKPAEFYAIIRIRRTEFFWALIALTGVVLLGTLRGIIVAIVASLFTLAHQAADPPVRVLGRKPGTHIFRPLSKDHPEDETFPGFLAIMLEGRIFFLNADRIAAKIRKIAVDLNPKVIALDLNGVPDLEYTALTRLIEAENKLSEHGISLWLVGLHPEVLAMIRRSSLGATLGRDRMHFNMESALARYLSSYPIS